MLELKAILSSSNDFQKKFNRRKLYAHLAS